MGKRFDSILRGLTNGAATPEPATPASNSDGRHGKGRGWYVKSLSPEQLGTYRAKAHAALREGLTVFMSKSTVEGFNRLLKTEVTSSTMRRLLEEIANGTLTLTAPAKTTLGAYKEPVAQATGRHCGLPTVLSIDQLSAGMPFTLKQAAKILKVNPSQLYFRCITGRIHFERDKSRYLIPATEVQRLQVIGL